MVQAQGTEVHRGDEEGDLRCSIHRGQIVETGFGT